MLSPAQKPTTLADLVQILFNLRSSMTKTSKILFESYSASPKTFTKSIEIYQQSEIIAKIELVIMKRMAEIINTRASLLNASAKKENLLLYQRVEQLITTIKADFNEIDNIVSTLQKVHKKREQPEFNPLEAEVGAAAAAAPPARSSSILSAGEIQETTKILDDIFVILENFSGAASVTEKEKLLLTNNNKNPLEDIATRLESLKEKIEDMQLETELENLEEEEQLKKDLENLEEEEFEEIKKEEISTDAAANQNKTQNVFGTTLHALKSFLQPKPATSENLNNGNDKKQNPTKKK